MINGQEAAQLARHVRRSIRQATRDDGAVPASDMKLLARLSAYARESTQAQVSVMRESRKAAVVTVEAGSLSTAQAGELLDLTRQRVGALCRSGVLAAVQTAAGHWQVDLASAAALAARRKERDD